LFQNFLKPTDLFLKKNFLLEFSSPKSKERGIKQKGIKDVVFHVPHITAHTPILLNTTVFGKPQGKSWMYCEYVRELFLDSQTVE